MGWNTEVNSTMRRKKKRQGFFSLSTATMADATPALLVEQWMSAMRPTCTYAMTSGSRSLVTCQYALRVSTEN